jgi:Integrase zinc binding domain
MILSDALSRRPDHCPEEDETKEEILLPDDLFLNLLDVNPRDRITKNKEYNFDVTKAIELLQEKGPTSIQNDLEDWKIEEVDDQKTIFYKGKQYVPKDQELRRDILKLFHDHETAGHPGELETYNLVKQHYWWPGLRIFVKNYVKGCGICQQFKIDRNPSHPSFILVEGAISTQPFAHCSMDLITDLPPAGGSDSILVVVDQGLSKGVILCLTTKMVTMDGIGNLLHINDLDYQTRCCLIKDHNSRQKHLGQCCLDWGLIWYCLRLIIHKRMELQNESIKKSKHTWPFIVILIRKHGKRTWQHWNSLITIEDMLTHQRHHSKSSRENH